VPESKSPPAIAVYAADPVRLSLLGQIAAAAGLAAVPVSAPEADGYPLILIWPESGGNVGDIHAALPSGRKALFFLSKGTYTEGKGVIALPVRAGIAIDRVRALYDLATVQDSPAIGPYVLDSKHFTLIPRSGGDPVRLTEKERDILAYLSRNQGRTVERTALLREVWGYVDGVETHTLETHIYRLRQKIEADPANPAILLAEGSGYVLKG